MKLFHLPFLDLFYNSIYFFCYFAWGVLFGLIFVSEERLKELMLFLVGFFPRLILIEDKTVVYLRHLIHRHYSCAGNLDSYV